MMPNPCANVPLVSPRTRKKKSGRVEEGRVRVHDPFELVRWLALSQPDPRKALSELVQNSLDAGASNIHVTRVREKKLPCLKILDDGEGVIPEMERREALRYIATHIGHSRKRSLSPRERHQLMTQGQYGIGLLGFWSLGEMLEIRSSLPGQKPYRLVLYRDRPKFKIEPLKGKLSFDERWTEVVVVSLHKEAQAVVSARRAADFLASELRGQLIQRDVNVIVEDRMARGRSLKKVHVRPPRFLGERLSGFDRIEVPGYAPIRLELYLVGEDRDNGSSTPISLYAAGTLVAQSFHDLAGLDLDHPPWTDARLTGLVDFADLSVAPGSRRGVIPNEASSAFAEALRGAEPRVLGVLEAKEKERAAELDRNVIRDLKRAFRDFYRSRPSYTMLPTAGDSRGEGGESLPSGEGVGDGSESDSDAEGDDSRGGEEQASELFPPGKLDSVSVRPMRIVLEVNTEKRVRARALDATGREIRTGIAFAWELWGNLGRVEPIVSNGATSILAGDSAAEGILSVTAREEDSDIEASAAVPVAIVDSLPTSSDEGIPEPELVGQPGASWRSRVRDGRWQVNSGHPDYVANSKRPALKLRYLSYLFAKEVVLRSTQDPRLEVPLEQMVEITAYADRQLSERPPTGRRRRSRSKPDEG
jgi:hypothetical protein